MTDGKRIVTADEIVMILERVVEREGVNTRRQCKYVVDDTPHCIAACAYVELGVSVATLKMFEHKTVWFIGAYIPGGPELDAQAVKALDSAQFAQDSNRTWGEALESARSYLRDGVSERWPAVV
jgi:hypothetical protein